MINKTIHYVFFGKTEMPQSFKNCMETWKRVLDGYEIKRWDASLVEEYGPDYAKEALAQGNFAVASDWARVFVIYKYGGIYLDCDVEVYRPFDDLLKYNCFFAKRPYRHHLLAECFGAVPGNKFLKRILNWYDVHHYDPNEIALAPILFGNLFSLKYKKTLFENNADIEEDVDDIHLLPWGLFHKDGRVPYCHHLGEKTWDACSYKWMNCVEGFKTFYPTPDKNKRVAWSFWTKPCKNLIDNAYCYALSLFYAKMNGVYTVLYTDSAGKAILGGLPYDEVRTDLDNIPKSVSPLFFSYGKFIALQNEPLGTVHIDGDVILRKREALDALFSGGEDCVFQSNETGTRWHHSASYTNASNVIRSIDISQYGVTWHSGKSFNCGVMGFRNEKLRDDYIKCHQGVAELISNNPKVVKELSDRKENPELVIEQQFVVDITDGYTKKFILNGPDINSAAKQIGYRHYICQSKYKYQQDIRNDLKDGDIDMYNAVTQACTDINGRAKFLDMYSAVTPACTDINERAKFLDCLAPKGTDLPLKLYGTPGDGSYYMYPQFRKGKVLSLGIGNNVSWDLAMAEESEVELINMYDGTIDGLPCDNEKFKFHKYNVGNNRQNHEVRLKDILTNDTHVLKMDIEGYEYDVLGDESLYKNLDQLVVEFHNIHNIYVPFEKIINGILKYMVPIYCHTNNYGKCEATENGIVPDVLEITFLKKDYCTFKEYVAPPYYKNTSINNLVERFG